MAKEIMVLGWKGRPKDDHKIVNVLFIYPIDEPLLDGGGTAPVVTPSIGLPGVAGMPEAESGVTDDWKARLDVGTAIFETKVLRFGPHKTAFFSYPNGYDKEGVQLFRRFERYVDANGVELADQTDDPAAVALRVPMSNAVMQDRAFTVYANGMAARLAKYATDYADINKVGITLDVEGGA